MRWTLKTADPITVDHLAAQLSAQPSLRLNKPKLAAAVARLLVMRGVSTLEAAEHFLAPSLSDLHSPYLMAGMKAAVDRIEAAIENKESILIYGDYDVDGTTAIVILKTAIELCGGAADFHVPHRIRDGYDMRDDVIEQAAAAGIKLIISVDMGIRAFAPAETARRLSVDLIVTDHHLPGPQGVPSALAVSNPNQRRMRLSLQSFVRRRGGIQSSASVDRAAHARSRTGPIAEVVHENGGHRDHRRRRAPHRREPRLRQTGSGRPAFAGAIPALKALLEVAQLSGRPSPPEKLHSASPPALTPPAAWM